MHPNMPVLASAGQRRVGDERSAGKCISAADIRSKSTRFLLPNRIGDTYEERRRRTRRGQVTGGLPRARAEHNLWPLIFSG